MPQALSQCMQRKVGGRVHSQSLAILPKKANRGEQHRVRAYLASILGPSEVLKAQQVELLLDTDFPYNINFLILWEIGRLEVRCGRKRRRVNLLRSYAQAEFGKFALVALTRLGGVVGDEDKLLPELPE
jgi:hypothetical protein